MNKITFIDLFCGIGGIRLGFEKHESKKPKAFLLENVPGILTLNNGEVYHFILRKLEELGYDVTLLNLDAKDYGVPQKRLRVYFIGILKECSVKFDYHHPNPKLIGIGSFIEKNAKGYEMSDHIINTYLFKKDDGRPEIVDENTNTPVKTLVSTYHKIQRLIGTFVRDNENIRLLTQNECKAIMGFPQDFKFPVSRTQMYRQMGNSVAVPVISDIAKQIKECIVA